MREALSGINLKIFVHLLYGRSRLMLTDLQWKRSDFVAFIDSLQSPALLDAIQIFSEDLPKVHTSLENFLKKWPKSLNGFYLRASDVIALKNFLYEYIKDFESDNLKGDYSTYKNHLSSLENLQESYVSQDQPMTISGDNTPPIRFYELLLSLEMKGLLRIISSDTYAPSSIGKRTKTDDFDLMLNVEFKNSPIEIAALAGNKPTRPPATVTKAKPRWEDITIKFKNGNDVDIILSNSVCPSDYRQMGFENKKTRRPNSQWEYLIRLAERADANSRKKASSSRLSQDYADNTDNETQHNPGYSIKRVPDKNKKRKQLLAQQLKLYFQIHDDPFLPYDEAQDYKIRINLIPVA